VSNYANQHLADDLYADSIWHVSYQSALDSFGKF